MMKTIPNFLLRMISIIMLAPIAVYILYSGGIIYTITLVIACILMIYEAAAMFMKGNFSARSKIMLITMTAYILISTYSMHYLRNIDYGREMVLWLVLSIWVCDIAAYATGNLIGGYKILPDISPKKTWSGFFGGAIAVIIFTVFYQKFVNIQNINILLLSFFIGFVAHVGDFMESYYKRYFKVKDSGSIIPGHGGVLDRLDSIMLSACVVSLVLILNS